MEYAFNATALGLGGVIERGRTTTIIPSMGSVVLPSTGGEGSAEVRNYDSPEISFSTLQTRVGGYRVAEDLFSAYSDILISNLNVLDRIRVALMQLTLTSTRQADPSQPEARFEIRASYRGVRIDDEEVVPQIDLEMCAYETYGQFIRAAEQQPREIASKLDLNLEAVSEVARGTVSVVRASVVSDVGKRTGSQLSHRKNKVDVPGLGRLHFGELLLKQGRRRVNLLRLDFGDPTLEGFGQAQGGTLIMAAGEGNGTPVWPDK